MATAANNKTGPPQQPPPQGGKRLLVLGYGPSSEEGCFEKCVAKSIERTPEELQAFVLTAYVRIERDEDACEGIQALGQALVPLGRSDAVILVSSRTTLPVGNPMTAYRVLSASKVHVVLGVRAPLESEKGSKLEFRMPVPPPNAVGSLPSPGCLVGFCGALRYLFRAALSAATKREDAPEDFYSFWNYFWLRAFARSAFESRSGSASKDVPLIGVDYWADAFLCVRDPEGKRNKAICKAFRCRVNAPKNASSRPLPFAISSEGSDNTKRLS